MSDHICCEHAREYFDDAERAWAVIRELERRGLVVANAVRGTQRYINGQKHNGRQANVTVADGSRGMERGR